MSPWPSLCPAVARGVGDSDAKHTTTIFRASERPNCSWRIWQETGVPKKQPASVDLRGDSKNVSGIHDTFRQAIAGDDGGLRLANEEGEEWASRTREDRDDKAGGGLALELDVPVAAGVS